MISYLRSILFNIIFFSYTSLILTVGVLFLPFPRKVTVWITRSWAIVTLWALRVCVGLDHKIEGLEYIKAPCIVASKHQSTWDTVIFHAILNDPAFVLKRELDRLSLGWYIRRLKFIIVDRDSGRRALVSMLSAAKEAAASERVIIIFPEGTRSEVGKAGTYHKGIAALYKSLELPVIPLALNSGVFWGRRSFEKKPGAITIKCLPPILPGLDTETFMATLETKIEKACEEL